jgi:DNA-binding NarL/FixJ family response regulator
MKRKIQKSKKRAEHKPRARIFLVDDHPVFREGLTSLLEREGDFAVCGAADAALQAFSEIQRKRPDLVLLDISLPGKSGLELIKDLNAALPDMPVLVVSMHDENLYAERVLRSGGRGYVMKQEGPDRILHGVRQVLNGEVFLSPKISGSILAGLAGGQDKGRPPISRLTEREFEVFQLIGMGRESRAIAKQLNLSVKTVDAHRGNLKKKLKMKNGTELICLAVRWAETARGV